MSEKQKEASTQIENLSDDEHADASSEVIEPEVLKKLPPEARKIVKFGMLSMQRFGGLALNPITEKLNEKHIDKILDISEKDDERAFRDATQSRRYTLIYLLIFAAIFIFLTIFLVGSDKELYKEIVKLLAIYLGGLGSGFGIKSYIDKDK